MGWNELKAKISFEVDTLNEGEDSAITLLHIKDILEEGAIKYGYHLGDISMEKIE